MAIAREVERVKYELGKSVKSLGTTGTIVYLAVT